MTSLYRTHIRWLIRRDMVEVLAIENQSFLFPWAEEVFLRYLRERNFIGMVATRSYDNNEITDDEPILGYMVYELQKFSLNVINFAVAPQHRRTHVGREMMDKLVSKLSSHRRTGITAEVTERNLLGQLFLRGLGFEYLKTHNNGFSVPDLTESTGLYQEDKYLFEYSLPSEGTTDQQGIHLGSAQSEKALQDLVFTNWREE